MKLKDDSDNSDQKSISVILKDIGEFFQKQRDNYQEILDRLREYANNFASLVDEIDETILIGIEAISTGYKGGANKNSWNSKEHEKDLGQIAKNVSDGCTWGSAAIQSSFVLFDMMELGLDDHIDAYGKAAEKWANYITELSPEERKKFMKELTNKGSAKDKIKLIKEFKKKKSNMKPCLDKEVDKKLQAKTKAKKAYNIKKYQKYRKFAGKTTKIIDSAGKITTRVSMVMDINKRMEKGESFTKAATKEGTALAAGMIAGRVTQVAVTCVPVVGPVLGVVAGVVVENVVSEGVEKKLDREWK